MSLSFFLKKEYDHITLIASFSLSINDVPLESFLQACDLTSLIKEAACFQSSCNPGCIDFILTNQKTCILSNTFEARLFDHQKLIDHQN